MMKQMFAPMPEFSRFLARSRTSGVNGRVKKSGVPNGTALELPWLTRESPNVHGFNSLNG